MPIPDYQSVMLPLLNMCADGEVHHTAGLVEPLADQFKLTPEERREMIASGQSTVMRNRVGWARTYLKMAGLVFYPKRGHIQISDRGRDVLQNPPEKITVEFLKQYPEFLEFWNRKKTTNDETKSQVDTNQSPDDAMEQAYRQMRSDLESEILENVMAMPPEFFEQLVVDLLIAMGYGGNKQETVKAVGQSGDEGIDGIINEDLLGLDVIYLQAKRWGNPVGRPEIQKFAGALQGKRARKGVFLTTSKFTGEARQYVEILDSKIVLIDGPKLASLMVDHDIGVDTVGSYLVKKVDADYFTGD